MAGTVEKQKEEPTIEEQKENILNAIRKIGGCNGYVSFAELERNLAHFEGDHILEHGDYKNIIYWTGMSEVTTKAFIELLKAQAIKMTPCSNTLVYMIDGRMLTWPLVKRAMAYKNPRWLPVTLSVEGQKGYEKH